MAPTSQPRACRGKRGGVHGFGQDDDSPGAAGGDPGGAEPRDGWVLEGLRHVRDLTIWHRPGAKSQPPAASKVAPAATVAWRAPM